MTVLIETPPVELPVVASPSVTRERTVGDVLLDAAALIEEYGWIQIGPSHQEGPDPRCAVSALVHVADYPGVNELSKRALARMHSVTGVTWLPRWNDAPGRTKQEVVAAFRKAAAES